MEKFIMHKNGMVLLNKDPRWQKGDDRHCPIMKLHETRHPGKYIL